MQVTNGFEALVPLSMFRLTRPVPLMSVTFRVPISMRALTDSLMASWLVKVSSSFPFSLGVHSTAKVRVPELFRSTKSLSDFSGRVYSLETGPSMSISISTSTQPMNSEGNGLRNSLPLRDAPQACCVSQGKRSFHTSRSKRLLMVAGSMLCTEAVMEAISCFLSSFASRFSNSYRSHCLLKFSPITPIGKAKMTKLNIMFPVAMMYPKLVVG
mmetsp:Transcript_120622/g.257613  ORF Transcript_120622/g.257613 Transcript_120622/m.257613 type:complete len:213 (+) Transcript_120622:419-1057(+)